MYNHLAEAEYGGDVMKYLPRWSLQSRGCLLEDNSYHSAMATSTSKSNWLHSIMGRRMNKKEITLLDEQYNAALLRHYYLFTLRDSSQSPHHYTTHSLQVTKSSSRTHTSAPTARATWLFSARQQIDNLAETPSPGTTVAALWELREDVKLRGGSIEMHSEILKTRSHWESKIYNKLTRGRLTMEQMAAFLLHACTTTPSPSSTTTSSINSEKVGKMKEGDEEAEEEEEGNRNKAEQEFDVLLRDYQGLFLVSDRPDRAILVSTPQHPLITFWTNNPNEIGRASCRERV